MSYKALKYVKRKHKVFKKYKDTRHPACRWAANKASRELKKANFNFEKKLAENIATYTLAIVAPTTKFFILFFPLIVQPSVNAI